MKCKVLSTTIVYADEYFKPGAIFDAKDEDVKGLVEGGFVEAIEAPKEAEVTEEPAEKPEAKGGKKK